MHISYQNNWALNRAKDAWIETLEEDGEIFTQDIDQKIVQLRKAGKSPTSISIRISSYLRKNVSEVALFPGISRKESCEIFERSATTALYYMGYKEVTVKYGWFWFLVRVRGI